MHLWRQIMPSSKQAYLSTGGGAHAAILSASPLHSPGTYWFILKMKFLVQREKKKDGKDLAPAGRYKGHSRGCRAYRAVVPVWVMTLLPRGFIKWSLLPHIALNKALHKFCVSLSVAKPICNAQYSACICLLVSPTTQPVAASQAPKHVYITAPQTNQNPGPEMLCVPRKGHLPSSRRLCVCTVFPARHYGLDCDRIKRTQPRVLGLERPDGGWEGTKGVWLQQFQAMRHCDLVTLSALQNRRGEICARQCSRYRELSMSLVIIKGQGPEGELFLVCLLKSPEERTQTWGETLLPWDSLVVAWQT